MDNTYVLIPKKKALSLLENNAKLIALEFGGVDNWSWYGDSLWDYLKKYFGEDNDEEVECFDFSDIAEDWIKDYEEINLDPQLLTDLKLIEDIYKNLIG